MQDINCPGRNGCRAYWLAGDENNISSLKKDDLTGGKHKGKQNSFARELSLDELDFVTAAGDAHYQDANYQRKKSSVEDVLNPLKQPFEDRI